MNDTDQEKQIIRKVLTRENVEKAKDLPKEWVDTPEWGEKGSGLYVRTMTGTERDNWEYTTFVEGKETGMKNIRASLVELCSVDEEGKRIFKKGDATTMLGGKSSLVLDRLFETAQRLNALRRADLEAKVKN